MKYLILTMLLMITSNLMAQQNKDISQKIIGMEKSALERWNAGDPSGFLDISANEVVYFDPFLEKRMDGHDSLSRLYEGIRGKVKVDKYEMVNPLVQSGKDMAVLTFNLVSYIGDNAQKWNCTEVYRLENNGEWEIIQTHWSFTKPHLCQ